MVSFIAVGVAAFIGGALHSIVGYLERPAGETFEQCKLWPSMVRSLVAGIALAVAYDYTDSAVNAVSLGGAFLAGYGWDTALHSLAGFKPPTKPTGTAPA